VSIDVTWKSLFRIFFAAVLGYAAFLLWPLAKLLLVSILIAAALYPIVKWARRRGWPRWVGLLMASLTLIIVVGGCFGLLGPMVYQQATVLSKNLPTVEKDIIAKLPPSVRQDIQSKITEAGMSSSEKIVGGALAVGATTVRGIFDFLLILVLSIYFMIDGERTIQWLRVFFPVKERARISQALAETNELIVAYMVGQFITSALAAAYVFILLSILHVPLALLLGIIAGIFDILPIIGVVLSVLPAALMALTVSPMTSLLVVVLYVAYHLCENYFIVPKVYGKKLRLSTLTVLLSITIAGTLAGVIGAIIILPIVAAYPVIERLWLRGSLEPDTVAAHQKQDAKSQG
jgi:predicted PurR-regulated permease PerM